MAQTALKYKYLFRALTLELAWIIITYRATTNRREERHAPDHQRRGKNHGATLAVPNGPHGERRPADAIGRAVHVARIATGEIKDTKEPLTMPNRAKGGRAGGAARKAALSPERRSEIARAAAAARWS